MRLALLAIAMSLLVVGPTDAQVRGRAVVLTSDTFAINGRIIQLHGVDAIEFHQFCFVDGRPWACGASATRALQTLLDPVVVSCDPTGETNGEAIFAVCTSSEGDIAEILVRQGWALAYSPQSEDYVAAEEAARATEAGVWRGLVMEPWVYREDIAAIERNYAERAHAALLFEVEQRLTADDGGIDIFRNFEVTIEAETMIQPVGFVTRVNEIEPGFLLSTIETRGIFSWGTPARTLASWRRDAANKVLEGAVESVWVDLTIRPNLVVDVVESASYYAAMIEHAAVWIAQGRQPILLVAALEIPDWIAEWFFGTPPEGAVIIQKEDIGSLGYLGTVDGVDVFVGNAPNAESLLFPDDLLVRVAYGAADDGTILGFEIEQLPNPDQLVFRFSREVEWLGDTIVHIRYPYEEPETPYEGGN